MAIFHMAVRPIRRAQGRSAVAAAAYRAGQKLYDARYGRVRNFSAKTGVIHSEILLPAGAPERFADRETLWNAVEAAALQRNSRLAEEIEFAIPAEISQADAIELARRFALARFVASGLVCDLNLHAHGSDEERHTPHAHLLVATREVSPLGFGRVSGEIHGLQVTRQFRQALACETNALLAGFDLDVRIDHRSHAALGVRLVPQDWIGPTSRRAVEAGRRGYRLEEHQEIAATNAGRILAHPEIALDALMVQHTTFSMADLDQLLARHAREPGLRARVKSAVLSSPDLVSLGLDAAGLERMTSRRTVDLERDLEALVRTRAQGLGCAPGVPGSPGEGAPSFSIELAVEQAAGPQAGAAARDLPGTRAGAMASHGWGGLLSEGVLGRLQTWRAEGRSVRGLSVSEGARRALAAQTGAAAWTLVGLQNDLTYGFTRLEPGEILCVVEPWALHVRELDWIVRTAITADAHLFLVTPSQMLRGLEAGGALRRLASIWLTPAQLHLDEPAALEGSGLLLAHLDAMAGAGQETRLARALGRFAASCGQDEHGACEALLAVWARGPGPGPGALALKDQLILASDPAQVQRLDALARERALAAGLLGEVAAVVATSRGLLELRAGERVFFGATDRWTKVRSGELGSVEGRHGRFISVRMDDGRTLSVDPAYCQGLAHGYGIHVHHALRAQASSVFVVPDAGFGREDLAVVLSRGQTRTVLGFGPQVPDAEALARLLVRDRDRGFDGPSAFARRRGIAPPARGLQAGRDGVRPEARSPVHSQRGPVMYGAPALQEEHGLEL